MGEIIHVQVLVYHRPLDQRNGMLVAARKRIRILVGDKTSVLFTKPDRDWIRTQFELGRKVELTPDL